MKRTLQVFLGDAGCSVGTLHFESDGARERSAFLYAETWLADPERFALSPDLPLVAGPQFRKPSPGGSVFHAAFADTEPDGWARRVLLRDQAKKRREHRRAGREHGLSFLDALDFLLGVDDIGRVGAIRFRDEEGVFRRASEGGGRSVPPLVELERLLRATRAVETDRETAADLAYLLGRATSLGGMRPKATVVDESGRLLIGKFPSVSDERATVKGEALAMKLAAAAGIDTAPVRLVECEGASVVLVERFDRHPSGSRLHYLSAASMLGAEPDDPDEHTYTEIVDAIRSHSFDPSRDLAELWRRVAFSILVTNVDDHLRNHGFLHVGRGRWRLSPAFDLNPFPERRRELKTWLSEDAGPEATIEALMSVCAYFRLPLQRARAILGEVAVAVSRWRVQGRKLGMGEGELERFAEAFEHREGDIARREAAQA